MKPIKDLIYLKLFPLVEGLKEMKAGKDQAAESALVDANEELLTADSKPKLLDASGGVIEESFDYQLSKLKSEPSLEIFAIHPDTAKDIGMAPDATRVYVNEMATLALEKGGNHSVFMAGNFDIDGELWAIGCIRPSMLVGYE